MRKCQRCKKMVPEGAHTCRPPAPPREGPTSTTPEPFEEWHRRECPDPTECKMYPDIPWTGGWGIRWDGRTCHEVWTAERPTPAPPREGEPMPPYPPGHICQMGEVEPVERKDCPLCKHLATPSPEDRGAEEAAREFFDEPCYPKCVVIVENGEACCECRYRRLKELLLRREREALGRAALWCREYADIVANQPILKATPFQIAMACAERIEALGARAIEAERGGKS